MSKRQTGKNLKAHLRKKQIITDIGTEIMENNQGKLENILPSNPAAPHTDNEEIKNPEDNEQRTIKPVSMPCRADILAAENKKINGQWRVKIHQIKGREFDEIFSARKFNGHVFNKKESKEILSFNGRTAVKKQKIAGDVIINGHTFQYLYVMKIIMSYELSEAGKIVLRNEGGYTLQKLSDGHTGFKDIHGSPQIMKMSYYFNNQGMVLEQQKGGDYRQLVSG